MTSPTAAPIQADAPPTLRDRGMQALLLVAAALLGWSWSGLEGYQIADAVEYLERAYHLVRSEPLIDSQAIRAFGFSGVLIPLFAVAEALEWLTGFQRHVFVVHAARLLQIGLTLGLVATTVRIGTVFAGRGAGYAAGLLLAANPIVLRWGVSPVSGIAAGLFVALAVELLVRDDASRGPRRRGWLAGLALGAAFMMAYQTITVIAPIAALALLPRKSGPRASRLLLIAGIATCVLAQCALDGLYYGSFGKSVVYYVGQNFGTILAVQLHRVGQMLGLDVLSDWARSIYNAFVDADPSRQQALVDDIGNVRSRQPRHWYVTNLPHALTIPGIGLLGLGIVRSLRRMAWGPLTLLIVIGFNVALMSEKGAKDYRLWLPFLSMFAVLGGLGWAAVAKSLSNTGPRALRLVVAIAAVALVVALGVREHAGVNMKRFGAFWRAMDYVNGEARLERGEGERYADPKVRVACAFHWALFLRESPDVLLIKLPKHMDGWNEPTFAEELKVADLATIATLDWFIVHLPILTERPRVMKLVNELFAVRAVFYERRDAGGMGPVFVMKKRDGGPLEHPLYDVREGVDPAEWAAARGLKRPVTFVERAESDLTLLGAEFSGVAGDGHGWVTYHWYGGTLDRDYYFVDRITSPGSPYSWHNNHRPAYGIHPTSSWPAAGQILSEGYLVVPEADPYSAGGPDRYIGGPYMRGDLVPGDLWFDVGTFDAEGELALRLEAVRPEDRRPVRELAPPGAFPDPDGWRTSPDGMTWITSFMMPVSKGHRRRAGG